MSVASPNSHLEPTVFFNHLNQLPYFHRESISVWRRKRAAFVCLPVIPCSDTESRGVGFLQFSCRGYHSIILTPKRKSCKSLDDSPNAANPEDNLPMGDALAMIWGEVGLTEDEFTAFKQEIARNKKLVEPMTFD